MPTWGISGRRRSGLSWLGVVLPSLILNYAGQAAIVLDGAPTDGNIFYRLCPGWFLIPMVILATLATIIASQAIITGAYSMTRQAIQLGWLPRLAIKQTSAEGYGQIYVGSVNWLLMLCHGGPDPRLPKIRQSGQRLRHRGVADNADDHGTFVHRHAGSVELGRGCRRQAVAALFLVVDAAFFCANLSQDWPMAAMCLCCSPSPSTASCGYGIADGRR